MTYNLNRFIKAQNEVFEIVYDELTKEKKETHWMWYIFPQIYGLGKSTTAVYYSISNIDEAKEYLNNEILSQRMDLLVDVLLSLECNDAVEIFGFPDNLKLWSSMTLFSQADPQNIKFIQVLEKFFQGRLDLATINILKDQEIK